MAKHRLFIEDNSPHFSPSADGNGSSQQKKQCKTSARASKAGAAKTSTPIKKNLHQAPLEILASEGGATVRSPPTANKRIVATQPDIAVSRKDSGSESEPESIEMLDSISMNEDGFFCSSNQKLPYSYEEDVEILKYIFKGQCIFRVSSILLWKHLEHKKRNPKRTYQSLKNRFLRNIKPNLFTTYRHLIPDEETVQKILTKFPELKKQVGRKETLSALNLPERIPASKISVSSMSSTSVQERHTNLEHLERIQERRCLPHSPVPSTSQLPNNLNFHRKVELNDESLTVLVNLRFKDSPPKSTRIYDKFWSLKLKNKLNPCPTCGRNGGPEENLGSGAESDAFISNSVESKKSESSSRKKLMMKKSKSIQGQKRKKRNFISEACNSQRSCSPSLLNDVNDVDELDEWETKDVESKSKAAQTDDIFHSAVLIKEADSTPGEPSSAVGNKDTDSIYQSTAAEFRKLIDSDEEEVLVKKCLIKNRKSIGFDVNLSVEDIRVDSYFVKSTSPTLESATVSDSVPPGCTDSTNKTQVSSGKSLAQNMMNMLANTNGI